MTMATLEAVRQILPEAAKDIRLNLQSVLEASALSAAQKWGVAAASAIASRNPGLRDAVLDEAQLQAGAAVVEDARAAAVLMGMNNVYYRFRHMVAKPSYSQKPARLRMQRIAQPLTSKLDFELYCLAVSAVNGCEACVQAHEQVVVEGGLTEDHVHDAVRIAAVVHAAAVALES
jgi:lipoyl-dependent peroxiredoxin subunit D